MEAQLGMLIIAIIIFVVVILIIRWIGAWMLRIDEVISLLKGILKELRDKP